MLGRQSGKGKPRGSWARLAAAAFAGLLVAVVACGGEGEAPTESGAAGDDPQGSEGIAEAPAASIERLDAQLTIAVRRVPDTLDPLGDLEPWGARVARDLLFEGLMRRRPDGAPWAEAGLADVCVPRPSEAPKDVYCHLRDGAVFHDGEPVTPQDVEYSLAWWLDPRRVAMRLRQGLGGLRRIEIVDGPAGPLPSGFSRDPGRWVHIAFSRAEPLALERLADMPIVPRRAHRGRARAFGRKPVGTGPMKVTAFDTERLVLEPTEPTALGPVGDDGGRPVGRITLREMPDGAQVLTAMRRGEIQIAAELSPAHVPQELAKPGTAPRFSAYLLSPPRFDALLFNLRRGVPSGAPMRTLLDASIGRAALADRLGDLPSLPLGAPIDLTPPHAIDLDALYTAGVSARFGMAGLPPQHDAAKDDAGKKAAADSLEAQGWVLERGVRRRSTGSLRVVLMWSGASSGDGRTIAHALRDDWRSLGIIVPFATAGWSYLSTLMRKGEFDVALVRFAERSDADFYPYFHSRGDLNVAGVSDVVLDEALEAYRAAVEPAQRREALAKAAKRLSELRVTAVIRAPTQVMLTSKRIRGLEFEDDLPRLDRIRIAPLDTWILGQRSQ